MSTVLVEKEIRKRWQRFNAVYLDTLLLTGSEYLAQTAAEEYLSPKKENNESTSKNPCKRLR